MARGLILFALLIAGGLTLALGRVAGLQSRVLELRSIIVSGREAEPVVAADTLRRGEVLAQVFARQSLTGAQIAGAVEALQRYVNPRLLQAGAAVRVQRTAWDSLLDVTVRIDPDNEVRIFRDELGWSSELRELPVVVDTLLIAGMIETSLYESVIALPVAGLSQQERIEQLMWGIYRPFQWSIDFGIEIRAGDSYRAAYERHVRSDGSVRPGRLLAAEFVNQGKTHRAFWFEERGEYFDSDGKSMRRVFLKAPVDFRRVSSRFARSRFHPALGIYRAHLGTDYAADTGTPVYATADGTVSRAGWWGGYGRIVELRHANGYRTRYAHLSFIAKGIKSGVRVRQGRLIGHVGASGLATGSHLHYEMLRDGKAVDPRRVNLPSGEPIAADRLAEFQRERDVLLGLLTPGEVATVPRAD